MNKMDNFQQLHSVYVQEKCDYACALVEKQHLYILNYSI